MNKKDRKNINNNFNPDVANNEYLQTGGIDGLRKKDMKKIILYAVIFFILGFAISAFIFNSDLKKEKVLSDEELKTENIKEEVSLPDVSISVNNQPFGESVIISSLKIEETTWITIYESLEDDTLGNILGAGVFDKGNYENVKIDLLRETEGDSKYFVKILKDNGDRIFDHTKDLPIKDSNTKKDIMISFETTSGMPR